MSDASPLHCVSSRELVICAEKARTQRARRLSMSTRLPAGWSHRSSRWTRLGGRRSPSDRHPHPPTINHGAGSQKCRHWLRAGTTIAVAGRVLCLGRSSCRAEERRAMERMTWLFVVGFASAPSAGSPAEDLTSRGRQLVKRRLRGRLSSPRRTPRGARPSTLSLARRVMARRSQAARLRRSSGRRSNAVGAAPV